MDYSSSYVLYTEGEFYSRVFKTKKLNKAFLNKWVNTCCIRSWNIITPLQWASSNDHLDVVKYLIENGANIEAHGKYAIELAARNGHINVVECLLNIYRYSEEDIHRCVKYHRLKNSPIRELLLNYKKFSNTKACR